MNDDTLAFNGVDGRTGAYLVPPLGFAQLAQLALGSAVAGTERYEAALRLAVDIDFPLKEGEDPDDLSQAGWALVFPFVRKGSVAEAHQAAIREALAPLVALRRDRATRRYERRYRECLGADAFRPGETKQQFLTRMGAGPGAVDPDRFPYYVLLVASPEEISYRVQYQLDVQYAVGRIHFDTLEEYAHYAANVVEAETRPRRGPRRMAVWATENPDDRATQASARYLAAPLADFIERDQADRCQVARFLGDQATKHRLASLLGHDVPSLLVTASHGVGFPVGDPRQRADQGALLCQDWGGPRGGTLTPDHYFTGEDIPADADLRGMVGFHFACFGAGTPKHDDFSRNAGAPELIDIAPHAFVARLPQRMLGRAQGALACIGHVDRAWACSFLQADPRQAGGSTAQLAVFESTLKRLVEGRCVGHAMDYFDLRYAELASDLAIRIEDITKFDVAVDDKELARLWLYANDARDYAVIGDPAVRIGGFAAPLTAPARPEGNGSAEITSEIDYRLFGSDADGKPGLLKQFAQSTIDTLRRTVSDVLSLEVTTYAGDAEGGRAAATSAAIGQARSKAYTRCEIDGDTVNSVPLDEHGAVDAELWRIHEAAVAQARQQRTEILRLILSLLPGIGS